MQRKVLVVLYFFSFQMLNANPARVLIQKGWESLVQDKDSMALTYFQQALNLAIAESQMEEEALALLDIAICHHGASLAKGLEYANQAMDVYNKMEKSNPEQALEGRSRCLQLISTIYARQGKINESIQLSKQALSGFRPESDTMGYIGLICSSLGTAYNKLNKLDSAEIYHNLSLKAQLLAKNIAFLPSAYLNAGDIAMKKGDKTESFRLLGRGLALADSSKNKQAQSAALIAMGNWFLRFEQSESKADSLFMRALRVSNELSDKSFYIKAVQSLISLRVRQGNYKQAYGFQTEIDKLKDSINQWENRNIARRLEVEFEIAEKDRTLALVQKEKKVALLTNYLLWGMLFFLMLISGVIIFFLRKTSKKEKILQEARTALLMVEEEKKQLREIYLRNELEYKESQLSVITLQMIQKNELLQALKTQIEGEKTIEVHTLKKMISQGMNHQEEWEDFSSHFESINKNFYSRIKAAYPEISPNDLKICALIKMNLSIKEMAGILNISADSVKTARYRLRKKLQLKTEDNLTDFILNLK